MTLLFPLGLLALIGIPVIIVIYIIKNKYTEQTIASTYLWTLSERFLKRRLPIAKLAGLISLLLQIAAVILIALTAAHPVLTLPNAANAYCFVLDASGSMNIAYNEESTRFDEGKKQISSLIRSSKDGSTYTLIYAGDTAETVYEDLGDKDRALQLLNELTPSYVVSSLAPAIESAQVYYDGNDAALAYVITDKDVAESENVNIIRVFGEAENYALSDVSYDLTGTSLTVKGNVVSYGSDATLTVDLFANDDAEAIGSLPVETAKGEEQAFEIKVEITENNADLLAFSRLTVRIRQSDALSLDSEVVMYNSKLENEANILLVSETPFFIRAALMSAGYTQIEVSAPDDYKGASGYGLYVFESYLPDELPSDGAIWIFSPNKSVSGTNFSYQSEAEAKQLATYSTSSATLVKRLLSGVVAEPFELYKYSKCGLTGNFNSLITCDGNPLLFVGNNGYGNREVVFAFNVKDSAPFLLNSDFITIVGNLLDYSFPSAIDGATFYCGDYLQINRIAGCESIRVDTPLGGKDYPDVTGSISEYELKEAGTYKINLIMKDKSERALSLFVALPKDERIPVSEEPAVILTGGPKGKMNGVFDELWIIFIILAVIVVADFGVYCYEQYQLR